MRRLNRLPRWLRRWVEKRRAYWAEIRLENWAAGVDLREWARGYSEKNGACRPWSPVLEMFTD